MPRRQAAYYSGKVNQLVKIAVEMAAATARKMPAEARLGGLTSNRSWPARGHGAVMPIGNVLRIEGVGRRTRVPAGTGPR